MGKRDGGEANDDQWDVLPLESIESLENVIGQSDEKQAGNRKRSGLLQHGGVTGVESMTKMVPSGKAVVEYVIDAEAKKQGKLCAKCQHQKNIPCVFGTGMPQYYSENHEIKNSGENRGEGLIACWE